MAMMMVLAVPGQRIFLNIMAPRGPRPPNSLTDNQLASNYFGRDVAIHNGVVAVATNW